MLKQQQQKMANLKTEQVIENGKDLPSSAPGLQASAKGAPKIWETARLKLCILSSMQSLNSCDHFLSDCRIKHQICLTDNHN